MAKKENPKRRWFALPDSLTKREDGKGEYYNVEGRFQDHFVLNIEKSKVARHNVYDVATRCETRVVKAPGDVPAVPNETHIPIRFDKGSALRGPDFDLCVKLITRCWEAWEHYQTFREAPVYDEERKALDLINSRPAPATVMVDTGNGLKAVKLVDDDDEDDDEESAADSGASGKAAPLAPAKRASVPAAGRKPKTAATRKRRAA